MLQTDRKWGNGETFRHARHLILIGKRKRAACRNGTSFRRRKILGLDHETAADFLIGQQRWVTHGPARLRLLCSLLLLR